MGCEHWLLGCEGSELTFRALPGDIQGRQIRPLPDRATIAFWGVVVAQNPIFEAPAQERHMVLQSHDVSILIAIISRELSCSI